MPTEITLRRNKSQPLTFTEVDDNFENLKATADAAATGSGLAALTGRVDTIEGDYTTEAQAETIADAAVAAHVALPDPHTQYLTDAESVSYAATKAAADSLAAGFGDGATVIVDRDETRSFERTRYTVASAALINPTNDTSFVQSGTGAVTRTSQDKMREVVSVKDFGVIGDGSDESAEISAALDSATGKTLDFNGLEVSVSSAIAKAISIETKLKNGTLKYIGSHTEFVFRAEVSNHLICENFTVDANNLAAKALWARAETTTASVSMTNAEGKNCLQTASTGLAAGIYCTANTSQHFKTVELVNCKASDVQSSGGSLVGRGIMIENFEFCRITSPDVRRVGPHQDGDGIFAASANFPDAVLIVTNPSYEDCAKRSFKSQIENTLITDVVARRTQPFTPSTGQSEIDLQFGGTLDGLTCYYADASAPREIASGWNRGKGVSLKNIEVICDDETDVIQSLVSFSNNTANQYLGFLAENVKTNSLIRNALFMYSDTGSPTSSDRIFNEVIAKNIKARGFSASSEKAVSFITRGATAHVKAFVRLIDCNFGSDETIPGAYLDPAPGSTTFLDVSYTSVSNCYGFDDKLQSNTDTDRRVFGKRLEIAENASGSITVPMRNTSGRSFAKVLVSYTSNRDTLAAKLYTEGYWFDGTAASYYVETVAGNKSQANQGTISVTTSGKDLIISKTAGSLTAGGQLQVIVVHNNAVNE